LIDFGFSFSILYATSIGLGLHESHINPDMLPALNRAEYVITVLYVSSHQDFVDIRPRLNSCERDQCRNSDHSILISSVIFLESSLDDFEDVHPHLLSNVNSG
jgi:hypothetical protein